MKLSKQNHQRLKNQILLIMWDFMCHLPFVSHLGFWLKGQKYSFKFHWPAFITLIFIFILIIIIFHLFCIWVETLSPLTKPTINIYDFKNFEITQIDKEASNSSLKIYPFDTTINTNSFSFKRNLTEFKPKKKIIIIWHEWRKKLPNGKVIILN